MTPVKYARCKVKLPEDHYGKKRSRDVYNALNELKRVENYVDAHIVREKICALHAVLAKTYM